MGASQGKEKSGKKQQWNLISQLLADQPIEELKSRWDISQLEILEERVRKYHRTGLELKNFLKIYPNLKEFPEDTQKKIFGLFLRSKRQRMKTEEFLIGMTLVKNSHDEKVIAKMVFHIYSSESDPKKMDKQGFQKFVKENKNRLKNPEEKLLSWWSEKTSVSSEEFLEPFASFDANKFVALFEEDYMIEEKYLVQQLEKRKYITREVGEEVYLVEFKWYMQWKMYIQLRYGFIPKLNQKVILEDREEQLGKSHIKMLQKRSSEYEHFNSKNPATKKPGVIPNYLLIGDEMHELKENMREFEDFIFVPAWLWEMFTKTYQGHPVIKRLYPQTYCLKVYQVFVDDRAMFVPGRTDHLQLVYNEMCIQDLFGEDFLEGCTLMHKYPGMENWAEIPNLKVQIKDFMVNKKMFICFVPNNLHSKFIENYNVTIMEGDKKYVKNRICNYASIVYTPIYGALRRGFVIKIAAESVYVEFRNQENNRYEVQQRVSRLAKYNPNVYVDSDKVNNMAGLTNSQGVNSFENAVIQCLIRTPHLGFYFRQFDLVWSEEEINNAKYPLALWALSTIYARSSKQDLLQMNVFRKAIHKRIPKAEPQSEGDAHTFMLAMIDQLKKETAQQRENEKKQAKGENRALVGFNKIEIEKFFSCTISESVTCDRCKGKSETQIIQLTHTIDLPTHKETEIFFYLFPRERELGWKPIKYGLDTTITLQVSNFLRAAVDIIGIPLSSVRVFALKNGEWAYDIVAESQYEFIQQYIERGFKIIFYQVTSQNTTHLQVQFRHENRRRKYEPFAAPLLVEIRDGDTWKDAVEQIISSMEGKYKGKASVKTTPSLNKKSSSRMTTTHEEEGMKSMRSLSRPRKKSIMFNRMDTPLLMKQETNLNGSRAEESLVDLLADHSENDESRVHESNIFGDSRVSMRKSMMEERGSGEQFLNELAPYEIRVISNKRSSQVCYFCHNKFKTSKYEGLLSRTCKGCSFKATLKPNESQSFLSHQKEIVVVVDWDKGNHFDGFEHVDSKSCLKCLDIKKSRVDHLENLLEDYFGFQKRMAEPCPKRCPSQSAVKRRTITEYPNMLIIHLNRFQDKGSERVKLENKIEYPDTLFHRNNKYNLYGVIAHEGDPSSGHYYSQVKLDNYDEWFTCDDIFVKNEGRKEQVNPDAYILFYTKNELDPALMLIDPRVVG